LVAPTALTLKQQKSKAQNSSLRAQRNLGIAEPGGSALAHICGFAAQQEVARRPAAKIDAIAVARWQKAAKSAAVQVRRKVETIVTKRLNRAARSPNQVAAASPFLAERVPQ